MIRRHLLLFFCWGIISSLFANAGRCAEGLKSTGPLRPVNVDQVQMLSLSLDIELQKNAAVISAVYVLHNPGKAMTVEMGFPCEAVLPGPPEMKIKRLLPQLEQFHFSADGKTVSSKLVRDHAILGKGRKTGEGVRSTLLTGWQMAKLPFAPQQTRLVKVSYRNPYLRSSTRVSYGIGLDLAFAAPSLRYLFSAAAPWDGPIKTGAVTIRAAGVDPGGVSLSHPQRFQREGNTWTWKFADFEPAFQDDLEIKAGECEFWQYQSSSIKFKRSEGYYILRGESSDREELRKHGKWFFLSRSYSAAASSSLAPAFGFTYDPGNLRDREWYTAWAEGVADDGIGESITLTIKEPGNVKRLFIHNGYQKYPRVYEANNRIRGLAVSFNDGPLFSVELPDRYGETGYINVPADIGPLKTAKLTIQSVYPGKSFRDTCVTGIELEVQLVEPPPVRTSGEFSF